MMASTADMKAQSGHSHAHILVLKGSEPAACCWNEANALKPFIDRLLFVSTKPRGMVQSSDCPLLELSKRDLSHIPYAIASRLHGFV